MYRGGKALRVLTAAALTATLAVAVDTTTAPPEAEALDGLQFLSVNGTWGSVLSTPAPACGAYGQGDASDNFVAGPQSPVPATQNQYRQGQPANAGGGCGSPDDRSGLGFRGTSTPGSGVLGADLFELGTLTHFNRPIFANAGNLGTIELDTDFAFSDLTQNPPQNITLTPTYEVTLVETPNDPADNPGGECPFGDEPDPNGGGNNNDPVNNAGGSTSCADQITVVPLSSPTATIGSTTVTIDVASFITADAGGVCDPNDPLRNVFVTPEGFNSTSCAFGIVSPGFVTVTKQAVGGDDTFAIEWQELSQIFNQVGDPVPGSQRTSQPLTTSGSTGVFLGEDPANTGSFVSPIPVIPGTVEFAEPTVPAGWEFESFECVDPAADPVPPTVSPNAVVVDVDSGEDIQCTVVNRKQPTITIVKNGVPADATTFGFTATSTLAGLDTAGNPDPDADDDELPGSFDLAANGASQTFTVDPGTFSVAETPVAGWELTDLTCTVDDTDPASTATATGSTATGTADITVGWGDEVTCTYTNSQTAELVLEKDWVQALAGDEATLTADLASNGAGADDTFVSTAGATMPQIDTDPTPLTFVPGDTIDLAETLNVPANYTSSLVCNGGGTLTAAADGRSGTLTTSVADAGATITCAFSNPRRDVTVELVKDLIPDTLTDEFTLTIDGQPGGPATTTGGDGATTTATAFVGDTITVSEAASGGTDLSLYSSSIACTGPNGFSQTADPGTSLTFDIPASAADGTISCVATNERESAQLTVVKEWENAIVNDAVTIGTTGGLNNVTFASVADTPTETDTDPTTYTVYAGQTLTFSETFDVGDAANYDTALACTGAADTNPDDGLTIDVADTDITCTYTNARRSATFTLDKTWGADTPAGVTVDLDASATGPGPLAPAIDTTATAPAGAAGTNSMTIYSGQTIDFSEAFAATLGDAYTTSLDCGDVGTMTLTPVADGRSGTLEVGTTPTDATCTFTNTPDAGGVALQKVWSGESTGDSADLTVSVAGGASDTATSNGPDAPAFDGPASTTDNTAYVDVIAGDTVTFTETLTRPDLYTTTFACSGAENTPTQVSDTEYTLAIDPADIASDATIVCSFTNTRKTFTVELVKDWATSPSSTDAVRLELGLPGEPPLATATSVADGSADGTASWVFPLGTTAIEIAEEFTSGLGVNYSWSASCLNASDGSSPAGQRNSSVVDTTDVVEDEVVTCTMRNQRLTTTVSVEKAWINGADTDTVALDIDRTIPAASTTTGLAPVPAGGTGTVNPTETTGVTVWSGEGITVRETLSAANVGTYDASLVCVNASGTEVAAGTTDGTFVATATGGPYTCTFTNDRQTKQFTLEKQWVDPLGGTEIALNASAPGATPIAETVTSPTASTGNTMTVRSGDNVLFDETFASADDLGAFDTTLECTDDVGTTDRTAFILEGLTDRRSGIDVDDFTGDVTCTFTNTRRQSEVVVDKTVVGPAGDTFDLSIDGTVVVDEAEDGDSNAAAPVVVSVGQQVTVSEASGDVGDLANYTSELSCSGGGLADPGGTTSGSFTVPPGAADQQIFCTFTNTRETAELTLTKQWTNAFDGDVVDLEIIGLDGSGTGDSTAPAATNDATLTVYAGETVELAESFAAANVGDYATSLGCAGVGQTPTQDPGDPARLVGSYTVPPSPADVTCTFFNGGDDDLSIDKEFVSATDDDFDGVYDVEYTVTVTNNGSAPTTYDLVDTPDFDPNLAIDSGTADVVGGPVDPADWPGSAPWTLASDEPIAGSSDPTDLVTHVYTLTFEVDANALIGPDAPPLDPCDPAAPDPGTGLFNLATLTAAGGDPIDAIDCGNPELPVLTIDKAQPTVSGPDGSGQYTVEYDVTVANTGPVETQYTLVDAPGFSPGLTIVSGAAAPATGGANTPPNPPAYADGTDWVLAGDPATPAGDDQVIDTGETHTYTVTFIVDGTGLLDGSQILNPCVTDQFADGQGLFNLATITYADATDDDDACDDPPVPDLEIDKTVVSVTDDDLDGIYDVVYEITVENTTPDATTYDLVDVPDFDDDLVILTGVDVPTAVGDDLGTPAADDITVAGYATPTWTLVAGQAIDGNESHVYTLTFRVDATGLIESPTATITPCSSETGAADEGLFNQATLTYAGQTKDDSACDEPDLPDLEIEKAYTDTIGPDAAGLYTVTYEVQVVNAGDGATEYDLADVPSFDDDLVIVSGAATTDAPGAGAISDYAATPWTLATAQRIEPGATHTYTLTFVVDGTAVIADPDLLVECGTTPVAGEGLFNGAELTYLDNAIDDSDCTTPDVPIIEVTKVVRADQPVIVAGITYTVTYDVTVDNVGAGDGIYTLVDVPGFAPGATITAIAVSGDASIDPYTAGDPIVTDQPLPAGESDAYVVTVTFDVDPTMTLIDRMCSGENGVEGEATYNQASVTYNGGGTDEDVDCVDIPPPNVDLDKQLFADEPQVFLGDDQWTVNYEVIVNNLDPADGMAGPGQYTLTDTFDFGAGVTVDSVTVTPTPSGLAVVAGFDGAGQPVLAQDATIVGGATHTYLVSVDVTITPGPDVNGDCLADGGLNNTAGLSVATDETPIDDVSACAGFSTLTLVKELINDDGGNATLADFVLTASVDGIDGPTTMVSGTSGVAGSVPAGDYDLAETVVAGYSTDGFACGDAVMEGQTVTVDEGANIVCTIVNDDEPVDLALTKADDGLVAVAGGDPFEYTISVRNVGDRDVDAGEPVTVTDVLPEPLQWDAFPDNCTQSGQTLTCDLPPAALPAGGDPVVITASVRAPASTPSGSYTNQAWVDTQDDPVCEGEGCEPPPCPATGNNNVDCEDTPVDRNGAVQIVKTDDVADGEAVEPGESFTYDLVVTNIGASTLLPGTVVDDDLPAQLELVSVTGGAGWTCNDADPIECSYAPVLAPGEVAPAITVEVRVVTSATGTEIDNTAIVNAAVDRDCPLPVDDEGTVLAAFEPACNQVTDSDDETTPMMMYADLAIVKTSSVDRVVGGESFEWVLEVTNNGPAVALDVVVADLVPVGIAVTDASSSFFDCAVDGLDVRCTRPSMLPGASGTVTVTVLVPAATAAGTITNVGTVESSTPEPSWHNNTDDDDVEITVTTVKTPLPVLETIPTTGSNSPARITEIALMMLVAGALGVGVSRRRRRST